jgi:predicted secreted protein
MAVKYAGKNGLVYLSTTGTASATSVGGFRSFTFDGSAEKIDVTSFGSTNRESVLSFPAFRGTIEGLWLSDDTVLRQASASADGTNLYLYPSSNAITKWVGGPAWIDMSLASAVDAAVTTSASFEARGAWTNQL